MNEIECLIAPASELDHSNGVAGQILPLRLDALRTAAYLALDCGEVEEARRLTDEAFAADPNTKFAEEWIQIRDITVWPDAWLIAAVRRDPPDVQALDTLADRYWKPLFGRCQLLTQNREKASDLAQAAWCRLLRARNTLRPEGHFSAYITTIATNLWRDKHRSARRAGPLAEHRLESLDITHFTNDGETIVLADAIPDLKGLSAEQELHLKLDIDQGLERLTPQSRDMLVSRYIAGESCAEIGLRYGRTEQTVSAWVRDAVREMKLYLEGPAFGEAPKKEP